jgi:hypothetical protein
MIECSHCKTILQDGERCDCSQRGGPASSGSSQWVWVLPIPGALAGAAIVIIALNEDSSPKQAAAASLAAAVTIIPYCIARAVTELSDASRQELAALNAKMAVHTRLLAELANRAASAKATHN